MKIYAKQVPPEYQQSPLFMDEWPENVFVFGNRDFIDHSSRLEDIRRALDDLAAAWDDLNSGAPAYYNSWIDALNEHTPRDDGREYTRAERLQFIELANDYCESSSDERELLCAALELITGQEYENDTIRGCSQGDWQEIIYPAEYGREWLCDFETEYFNTGAEWRISENDPENDDNYYIYTHAWRDDDIRAEIAAAAGVEPCDVILYQFTGWSRSPEYMEVS
jgi:hypothetical protein